MTNQDIILLQEASKILYWYSREDYLNNYPNREYDQEIIQEQEIAAFVWKQNKQLLDELAFMQKTERAKYEI